MSELIKLVNDTEAQCNILLPRRNIDIRIAPMSESVALSLEVLPLINHYISAFNLKVVNVKDPDAVKVEIPVEVVVNKSDVEALTNLVSDNSAATEVAPVEVIKVQESSTTEVKKYTENELHAFNKGEVVSLAESLSVNADGTKGEIITRIIASQG